MEKPITFTNEGQQLIGILHTPEDKGTHPGVLLLHGCTGNKSESHWIFVKLARTLCEAGFAVLRFDFRNSCDSAGTFEKMTISGEISDGLRALDVLSEQGGSDAGRIGILGLSLGGCVAACVAGRSSRVRSTVLWAPVGRPEEDFQKLIDERYVPIKRFPIEQGGFRFGQAFYDELPKIHPQREICATQGPVLIVSGSEDKSVSPLRAVEYQEILLDHDIPCERILIEEADHTFTQSVHESMAIQEAIRFFLATL
ncbi:MAG: alpha/beta fold hydrolase [Candidatus Latescibacterota bacterium]